MAERNSNQLLFMGLLVALFAGAYWMDLFGVDDRDDREAKAMFFDGKMQNAEVDAAPGETQDPARTMAAAGENADAQPGLIVGTSKHPHQVTLRLVDEYDQPLADALVVPWRGEELIAAKRANGDGVVVFENLNGSGGLVIDAPGWYPQFLEQTFAPGEAIVRVLTRAIIAGRVEFFGSRQEKTPFQIGVYPVPHLDMGPFPASLKDALEASGIDPFGGKLQVEHDLTFQLKGVPDKWSGRLRVPHGCLVKSFEGPGQIPEDGANFIELVQPDDRLRFELVKSPEITGRVVTPDLAHGVGGAGLNAFFRFPGPSDCGVGATTDENGYFRISLPAPDKAIVDAYCLDPDGIEALPVRIWLDAHQDWAGNYFEFDMRDQADPWSLGDLPLQDMRKQAILVVDEFGEPIEGALAFTEVMSEPTNAAGETEALLRENNRVIAVAADGYQTQTQTAEPGKGGAMRFMLEPAVELLVKWRLPEDGNPMAMRVRVRSEGDVFAAQREHRSWKLRRKFGEPMFRSGSFGEAAKGQSSWVKYTPKADQNEFRIVGLAPNTRMRVQLIGRLGSVMAQSEPLILGPGEKREITLPEINDLATFTCRVIDPTGQPIPFARVEYRVADADEPTSGESVTGSDGEFQIEGIGEVTLHLTASAGYYKDSTLKYIRIFSGMPPLEITLQPKVP